jgi:hypothetical protein
MALALLTTLAAAPLIAAVIYGRVTLPDGSPLRSGQIQLNGRGVGQTDDSGNYQLNLPPGTYTLKINGKDVPVIVPPTGIKTDITLPR